MSALDGQQTDDLLRLLHLLDLRVPAPDLEVWREILGGRFVVMLRYGAQTYCLLPLALSLPPDVPTARATPQ